MFGDTYVILIGHYHAPEEHYHYAIAVNVYSHIQSLFFTNRSHFYPKECSKYVKRVSAHHQKQSTSSYPVYHHTSQVHT